jgi:hypothetical protein
MPPDRRLTPCPYERRAIGQAIPEFLRPWSGVSTSSSRMRKKPILTKLLRRVVRRYYTWARAGRAVAELLRRVFGVEVSFRAPTAVANDDYLPRPRIRIRSSAILALPACVVPSTCRAFASP